IAGALIVVIGLLVYFLLSQETRPVPPPPKVDSTPKVDLLPPKVDPLPPTTPPEVAAPVPVTLTIATRPPGADVVVDGEAKGQTPLRLPHKSGVLLHMELRKKGYEPYSEDLQPEKDLNVDIKLDKEQRGKRPGGGKVSKPGGRPAGPPGKTPGHLPSELRDPFKRK
ncbi:MAG TPA: PEGA domain-containing protein, partial [Pseudomonadota bacterium]|nr:PEGA domain-containing protein [Pseudomonadota bacterium]